MEAGIQAVSKSYHAFRFLSKFSWVIQRENHAS
jgi:hypothetical protein